MLRAHIASTPERNKGWLRAVSDPQLGSALSAIHERVNTPWKVESLADAAGMSHSAFAARFKKLLGQTPLEYVTGWRRQKAMQLLEQRDKKLIDVARLVGYESDAAFSKAFIPAFYERLMGSEKCDLVITDPPYNVVIDGHATGNGSVRHREFGMASGEMSSAQFADFLRKAMMAARAHSADGSLAYYFMDWRHMTEMLSAGSRSIRSS